MLATGSTMINFYKALKAEDIDYSRAKTFNLDEYHESNNFKSFMTNHLFQYINLPKKNIYFPTKQYEKKIFEAGGIDLCVLGIGINGHIAFNEPGTSKYSRTRLVTLDKTTRNRNKSITGEAVPQKAMTVGIRTILESKEIWLLAKKSEKEAIFEEARFGPITEKCPASFLQHHPNMNWLLLEN